ncbi:hypothetical protein [Psychrobacter sanguinis]|uniref:hypothetical protein n=1 Tax=Psychrobacter sanguinis TaxID=861445 RepID=UPI00191959CF|nr:hypothetical protein [Psychrobacter sanguinis]MDN5565199.1 hypothetical protein [Psychrobacter sp.]UEC24861.1 hypothetical protein LK453_09960 [Psychrobacter sanguinis]
MLPNNKIKRVRKWLEDLNEPRDRKHPDTRSFCLGGADIGDITQGIKDYVWQAWTDGAAIYLQRTDVSRPDRVLTDKNITSVSVAFDRNMNLVIAYQAGIDSKLWVGRNGSLVGGIAASIRGGITPMVALDDNRYANDFTSDVIFAYIKDSMLCCRYQREQYRTEHKLQVLESGTNLYRMGMGRDNRFLFLLQKEVKN